MNPLVLDWPAAAAAGAAVAGGKGWQLGRMSKLGVPVPDGFVLAADASLRRNHGEAVPDTVLAAIAQALGARGWQNTPLAVRSSAPQEDSARRSFAGIHETRLNVIGMQALADAVKYATDKGCLVVAAMGNEGSTNPDYPAACPGAMPVGATSDEDTLPNFTNCGPHLSVVAPGVQVMSTFLDGGYETLDGTSMATPHVAGLAALLKSQHPTWTPAQLRARIEDTADDKGLTGYDIYFGHGRINAARAVKG